MGASGSTLEPMPPWVPYPSVNADGESLKFTDEIVREIQGLSDTADTFLHTAEDRTIDIEDEYTRMRMQGAVMYDKKIQQWLARLVPKRVSEQVFFANYFHCVDSIVARAVVHKGTPDLTAASLMPVANTPTAAAAKKSSPSSTTAKLPNGTSSSSSTTTTTTTTTARTATSSQQQQQPPASSSTASSPSQASRASEAEIRKDYSLQVEEPLQTSTKLLRPIRWGIIGCGAVCEVKSGPALYKAPGSVLVAVMCRSEQKAKDFAHRHNVSKWYTNMKSLIYDVEVDAVYIATPPGSHREIASEVCAAGKPCFVEKPMARNYEECRSMVEEFYRANVPLYVAYYRRRHDRFVAAKQIIDRFLGDITSVSYVMTKPRSHHAKQLGWRVHAEESGGGLFMDLGSHTLDILDYLLGPLAHITGDATTHPSADPTILVETQVSMTFRTQHGAVGTAMWDFTAGVETDLITIRGTTGMLTMSTFGTDGPVLHLPQDGRSIEYEHTMPQHMHLPLVTTIVAQLRGVDVPEDRLSTGLSASRTALIMDSVLRKFYRVRTDQFWKRPHTWDNNRSKQ